MQGLANQIPRIQAERTLLAAQAAVYPHMGKDGARRWWDSMVRRTQQAARVVRQLFTWGGQPVTPEGLKARLSQQLGGGFQSG